MHPLRDGELELRVEVNSFDRTQQELSILTPMYTPSRCW